MITLFLLACVLYFAGRAPFLGQWDSFDYMKQIVTHQLSDLGFGRPVFIGYNILLWEAVKRLFGLQLLDAEWVVMAGIILTGAVGVLLFAGLARHLLPGQPARMAALALLLSPMYAVYSGFIMTEVPMITAVVAAALILLATRKHHRGVGALVGGLLFGISVGMREQAITLSAAFLWIIWIGRPDRRRRLEGLIIFALASLAAIVAPILGLYVHDPVWFFGRTRLWLRAIPMGEVHFWRNLEASLLFLFAACPGAWLALAGGAFYHWHQGRKSPSADTGSRVSWRHQTKEGNEALHIAHPLWGIICCLVLPIAALWRDADVQIHPRYAMIGLPAALILCSALYNYWLPSKRAAVIWAILQVSAFGAAQAGFQPLRQIQRQKHEYTNLVLQSVPEGCLLIPGGYSPIFDYYRGIGVRPQWRLLWSGWGWDRKVAEVTIRQAWRRHEPVYLCNGPHGWLYFEEEWLDLYFIFRDCPREEVAPGIVKLAPPLPTLGSRSFSLSSRQSR